jgi:hypothetical protein
MVLFSYLYIKWNYGFWMNQPVYHAYNINYMFYPPGIINHSLPKKNKYTNFKNIETFIYSELSPLKLSKFVNLIKYNYLQNKHNIFSPQLENIKPYFQCHNAKSFISFYNQDNVILDSKSNNIITDSKIIGVMTTRPVHIVINNGDKDANFDAYYVDYLCIDKSFRKKGIAPQIIQTHHYNQRYLNKNIVVSLFKRETNLTGIVPLCVYSTYGFSVNKWSKPLNLDAMYKLLEINEQNFHFLSDFIKLKTNNFDIIINSEFSNIIELIKTKNIFIYVIIVDNKIVCAYFYRKTCTHYDKNMEVLSCFASINDYEDIIFIRGFKISFWKIASENYFGFAAIENISHNNIIINNLLLKNNPLIISPTAYFFYNFAYNTFKSQNVLIIN